MRRPERERPNGGTAPSARLGDVHPDPLVLLDLDGTLLDSGPGITSSAAHAFRALDLPVPSAAELRTFVGPPIWDSFGRHGVPAARTSEAVAAYRAAFADGGMYDTTVYPGIPEALRELRDAGVRLLVATSKPEVFAGPVCDRTGLTPLLDGVFGAPLDESATKADVVGRALASTGPAGAAGRGRTLMVGDREHDVLGARAHGVPCLGVAWGYAPAGELEEAGAVAVLPDPEALGTALLRARTGAGNPTSCTVVG